MIMLQVIVALFLLGFVSAYNIGGKSSEKTMVNYKNAKHNKIK